MLKSFEIRNYALIEHLTVEFDAGLNIITGETGAGKSIIIDALSLVLGERADTEVIRRGADKTVVETVFVARGNDTLKRLFTENDLEWNDDLILRREVSLKGQSRCFVNDSPVTLSLLKEIGNRLVDLHGQHEHQSLLRTETHIDVLDGFGGLEKLRAEFAGAYQQLLHTVNELTALRAKEEQLKEKRALYEFQIKEIDTIGPRAGEEEELENELRILENAEKLFDATSRLYNALYEGDNAVHDQLVLVRNTLEDLATIDTSFNEAKTECASAVAVVSELAKFIQQYNSRIEFNPERLEQIRERLGQLTLLKKKYGGSVDSVLAHRKRIGAECTLAENFESTTTQLTRTVEQYRETVSDIAQRLSKKRQETAKKVDKEIGAMLEELGISNGTFKTSIVQQAATVSDNGYARIGNKLFETTPTGIDVVEFYVSTNIGEEPKPLAKVASGGEISRIMLAMKSILATSDRLPLLIFDEIDAGVSGRIALAVGRCLKDLSKFHQIIAITHLPQIAALADTHFSVEKVEDGERTYTRMHKLKPEERVREIASLMSGAKVTQAGLAGAKELMGLK